MKSFLTNLEAKASSQGKDFKIPREFIAEYIMDKMQWDEQQLRCTPAWRIEKLLTYWHLISIAQDAEDRKAKQKAKSKRG